MSNRTKPPPPTYGPLPLVLAVTGHRDLRAEDRPATEQRLRGIFADLQRRYPATPLVLLTPLAEGADRLAARVALDRGVRLIVPLPMPQAEYERDFATPESRAEFADLLQKADRSFALDEADEAKIPAGEARDRHYAQVGAYIARHSQILIALWDGVATNLLGGTAQVVYFKRDGVLPPFAPPRSPLDPVESGPVYHILTPRHSNPQPAGEPFTLRKLYPGEYATEKEAEAAYHRIYQHMDTFNRDAVALGPRLAERRKSSKADVLPEDKAKTCSASLQATLQRYALADCLAVHFQRLTLWTVRGLLLLGLAAAVFFQVYTFRQPNPRILAVLYLAALCVAYAWYLWGRWGDYHNRYLDYRALAEGLRVHVFWRLADLKAHVADHYLRKQRGELDWIRQALRVWSIPAGLDDAAEAAAAAPVHPEGVQLVLAQWVRGQAAYFDSTTRHEAKRRRILTALGYGLFLAGLALAVVKVALDPFPPLLLAMSLTMVAAALLHVYAETLVPSQHVKQFGRMGLVYANAARELETLLDARNFQQAQGLIEELGREALAENGDWVLLHRERPPEVPR